MANKLDFYLAGLLDEAESSLAIEKIVRASLPRDLGKFCSIGRLSQGRLQIYADNGSVAAKVRQLSQGLLERLQSRGLKIDSLKILVRVNPPVKPAKRSKPEMGEKGLKSFRELAGTLPDSPLKSSIESLLNKLDDEKNPFDDVEKPENR